MNTIAKGKDAVLEFLEKESQRRSGKVGEYILTRDNADNLIAIIAGMIFLGTGTVKLQNLNLTMKDGIVINVQQL